MPDEIADQLRAWAKAAEDLRVSILLDADDRAAPIAEQNVLLAMSALEQAQRFFTLAAYYQMRGE